MQDKNPDHPRIIARPPFIYFAFIIIGAVLNRWWPMKMKLGGLSLPLGWGFIAVGLSLMTWGVLVMKKANTPVDPHETPTALVVRGPFRFSRNPLYISLTLIYIGIAVLLRDGWIFCLLIPLLMAMYYGVILREEEYLEKNFEEEYWKYKRTVRRWI